MFESVNGAGCVDMSHSSFKSARFLLIATKGLTQILGVPLVEIVISTSKI